MHHDTRISSGRVHKRKDNVLEAVRYLNVSKIEIFKKFKVNNPQVRQTSFFKYLKDEKHIKKIERKQTFVIFAISSESNQKLSRIFVTT